MPDKGWKQFERRVAEFFSTKRTPLSGGNSGHSRSDSLHPLFFLEAKIRKSSSVHNLHRETYELARKEKKIPVLALQKANHPGFLVALHSADLEDFCYEFLLDRGYHVIPQEAEDSA